MLTLGPLRQGVTLSNGDGFAFQGRSGVTGFRGDRCEGRQIWCKQVDGLRPGVKLWRNVSAAFEREIDARPARREISVDVDVRISGSFVIDLTAYTEDGRTAVSRFNADVEKAENRERSEAMLREQLSKRCGEYAFTVRSIDAPGALPLLSAGTINSMRRLLASDIPLSTSTLTATSVGKIPTDISAKVLMDKGMDDKRLMLTRYCVRYELGMCPRYQGAKQTKPLFLVNNGRRMSLKFDCANCEMTVEAN